jgi:hypothetical protein
MLFCGDGAKCRRPWSATGVSTLSPNNARLESAIPLLTNISDLLVSAIAVDNTDDLDSVIGSATGMLSEMATVLKALADAPDSDDLR